MSAPGSIPENLMDKLIGSISSQVVQHLNATLTEFLEKELTANLTRALVESEFYRSLSDELRAGLQGIYKEISHAASGNASATENATVADHDQADTDQLFMEASSQLDEIFSTTEKATMDIMDIVEKHIEGQMEAQAMLDALAEGHDHETVERLRQMNIELNTDLMTIMTSLSFQDLTGQRIRKIIDALKTIENVVFELYMTTGIILKAREESPDKDLQTLKTESKRRVEELKDPDSSVSQDDVDGMLKELGL